MKTLWEWVERTFMGHDDGNVHHELHELTEAVKHNSVRLFKIEKNQERMMSQTDDLVAAVAALKVADEAEVAAVAAMAQATTDEIQRVEKVIADLIAGGGASNPLIAQAITDLGTVSGNLGQSVTTLAATTAALAGEQSGGGVVVSISPTAAAVVPGGTQQFVATVTGSNNVAVNYSVIGAGSVDANGLYTAGNVEGGDTVVATSQVDATKSASAQVTIAAVPPPPAAFRRR